MDRYASIKGSGLARTETEVAVLCLYDTTLPGNDPCLAETVKRDIQKQISGLWLGMPSRNRNSLEIFVTHSGPYSLFRNKKLHKNTNGQSELQRKPIH